MNTPALIPAAVCAAAALIWATLWHRERRTPAYNRLPAFQRLCAAATIAYGCVAIWVLVTAVTP